jgi:hypothetical protein
MDTKRGEVCNGDRQAGGPDVKDDVISPGNRSELGLGSVYAGRSGGASSRRKLYRLNESALPR